MSRKVWIRGLSAAALLISILSADVCAQVVENRRGEANPLAVIFRSTLFGAGTGLLLGGAYALIQDDPNRTTWDVLRWTVGGGAILGCVGGIIYVIARPEPTGSVGHFAEVPLRGGISLAPAIVMTGGARPEGAGASGIERDAGRARWDRGEVRLSLLRLRF